NTTFAPSVPLPTMLGGTDVKVTDSTGTERPAGLFFVSGPANQINYQMPPGMADGVATSVVTLNGNIVAAGGESIAALAPGLFSFIGNGQGTVAGYLIRVRGDAQTIEQ